MSSPHAGCAPEVPADHRECVKKLSAARAVALSNWPYMAPALLRLAVRWSPQVPTLAVDKYWRLYVNPAYFLSLAVGEAAWCLVAHELQHAMLDHGHRLDHLRGKWVEVNGTPCTVANLAHDLAINSMGEEFVASGKAYQQQACRTTTAETSIPAGGLLPEMFRDKMGNPFPRGLTSEQYAELILANVKPSEKGRGPGEGEGKGACQCGSGAGDAAGEWEETGEPDPNDPSSGVTPEEQKLVSRAVAEEVLEHAQKYQGSVPAGIQRWAKVRLSPPKVDWRKELKSAVRAAVNWAQGQGDFTWMKRNRRQTGEVILPSTVRPMPKVVLVLDTSGSMHSRDFEIAFSEMAGVFSACGMPLMPVITCDAAANEIQWIRRLSDLKLVGGGGTDMPVGIAAAVAHKARAVIMLTDGYTSWPAHPVPSVRVLACLTTPRGRAPVPPDWIRTVYACPDERE